MISDKTTFDRGIYNKKTYDKYVNILSGAKDKHDIDYIRNKCPIDELYIIDKIICSILLNIKNNASMFTTNNVMPLTNECQSGDDKNYVDDDYIEMDECTTDTKYVETINNIQNKRIVTNITEKRNKQLVGNVTMNNIIEQLKDRKYRHECDKLITDLLRTHYLNKIQYNVIMKIISKKEITNIHINIDMMMPQVEKQCPHCGKINKALVGTTYIVCGVDMSGKKQIDSYNFMGSCFMDWCFVCGKKLCKHWYQNELFIEENRCHNEICCKAHAEKTNSDYYLDYCHCYRLGL